MTMKKNVYVAQTIKSQIAPIQLMAYAAHNFTYTEKDGLYGLEFAVQNTSKVKKGLVKIILNGADLYDIYFFVPGAISNKVTLSWFLKKEYKDIFADQLNEILDTLLETDEYLKDVNPNIVDVKLVEVEAK